MWKFQCVFVLPFLLSASVLGDEPKPPEGFTSLFNGTDLKGWQPTGKKEVWGAEKGIIFCQGGGGGWLMTEKEYGDFEVRVEYKMPKMGNSGVALRAPLEGDPAYKGMEIQLIDDEGWKNLQPWQTTGSIYNVVASSKRANKPLGEWNAIKIVCKGKKVTVELNGEKLVDADLKDYEKDHSAKHPGILRDKGHVGLQSYNYRVEFRNLWIKPL